MAVKYFCDRCNKQAANSPVSKPVIVETFSFNNVTRGNGAIIIRELCYECADYVKTAFMGQDELRIENRKQY